MPELRNANWTVDLHDGTRRTVAAAYWTIDVDTRWMEFKDPQHKSLFAAAADNVLCVTRLAA